MTRLEQIRERSHEGGRHGDGHPDLADTVWGDRRWLLARVDELAVALRAAEIGSLRAEVQLQIQDALAALDEPGVTP